MPAVETDGRKVRGGTFRCNYIKFDKESNNPPFGGLLRKKKSDERGTREPLFFLFSKATGAGKTSGTDSAAAGRRGWDGVPLAERLREQAGRGAERDGQPPCDALKKAQTRRT